MESQLRSALIAWLQDDTALANVLNSIAEEAPRRTTPPWLGLVASASGDWSTKDRRGREIRVALELHLRSDDPAMPVDPVAKIETLIESFPRAQPDFEVANITFLRARAEQRPGNVRAVLLEYRFRLFAA